MIIKLKYLLDSEKILAELMEQPLTLKLSYKLSKLLKKVSEEMREFYRLRENLIKNLGEYRENDTYVITDEDKKIQFTRELMELAEVNVEIPDFEPISISEFDSLDIKITPVQMVALEPFFKD